MRREQLGAEIYSYFMARKGKGILFNISVLIFFVANSRPNAQIQHIFVQNFAKKKQNGGKKMPLLLKKVFTQGGEQKILSFKCCKFFYFLLLKDRKKPVTKCLFSLSLEFVCYRRNENVFVPFVCAYVLNVYITFIKESIPRMDIVRPGNHLLCCGVCFSQVHRIDILIELCMHSSQKQDKYHCNDIFNRLFS